MFQIIFDHFDTKRLDEIQSSKITQCLADLDSNPENLAGGRAGGILPNVTLTLNPTLKFLVSPLPGSKVSRKWKQGGSASWGEGAGVHTAECKSAMYTLNPSEKYCCDNRCAKTAAYINIPVMMYVSGQVACYFGNIGDVD